MAECASLRDDAHSVLIRVGKRGGRCPSLLSLAMTAIPTNAPTSMDADDLKLLYTLLHATASARFTHLLMQKRMPVPPMLHQCSTNAPPSELRCECPCSCMNRCTKSLSCSTNVPQMFHKCSTELRFSRPDCTMIYGMKSAVMFHKCSTNVPQLFHSRLACVPKCSTNVPQS
jgi:hypothetical protein